MPITATLTVTPTSPGHGDTVTARYAVQGNDGTPAQAAEVTGQATVGGVDLDVSTVLTLPAVPPLPEVFGPVSGAGLDWQATADPAVWTAVVP